MARRMWLSAASGALLVMLGACGTDRAELPPDAFVDHDAPPGLRDVRVPIPTPSWDYLDLVTPEVVVQPGEDKMLCLQVRNDQGDLAIDSVLGKQGAFGHHMAVFSTDDPQPPGTLFDCTSAEANAHLRWFAFNEDFPAGDAIRIPAGMAYVIQFHYLNASDLPILVRDVERLHLVSLDSVTTWVSTMMALDLQLAITPGISTVSWDCIIPEDRDVLMLFGHMHELGASYSLELGPDASSLTTVEAVDPWQPWLRDAPRVRNYFDHPLHIGAGSILRTTCSWNNGGTATVHFPEEMCATFAYVASATQYACEPTPSSVGRIRP